MSQLARLTVLVLAFCATVPAFAQRAVIIELPSGQLLGVAYIPSPTGDIPVVLTNVQLIRVPKPPDPTPTPPPVTEGKRDIAIIHESGEVTERQASLHVLLQTHPVFLEWRKSKGHRLFILDDDTKDKTGQPSPLVKRFAKAIPAGTKFPALVILDQSSDAVLYADSLPADITVDGITELIKRHGG